MRLVDGEDHLQPLASVVHAAQRLAVLLDCVHQVLDNPLIPQAEPAVFQRLRLAKAGAGDLLPRSLAAAKPRWVVEEVRRRQCSCRQPYHALCAVDFQAEALARRCGDSRTMRAEGGLYPAVDVFFRVTATTE